MLLCEIDDRSSRRIDLSPLRRKFTPNLERLIKIVESFGFKIRIVGGAVRDILLGREPRDIDLLTDALPDAIMFILGKYDIPYLTKGIPHGTVKVKFADDEEYEITSLGYEVEDECCPQSVVIHSGQSWRGDAERRDFTIDTLSVDLDGLLYDYTSGVRDLRNQMIQFLGSPTERIQKDPVLILRFFKLLSLFHEPKFDKGVLPIIKEKMKLIKKLKPKRLELELSNIRKGPNAEKVLRLMKSLGFDDVVKEIGDKSAAKDKDKKVTESIGPVNQADLRNQTKLTLAKMPPPVQQQYHTAWARVEQAVEQAVVSKRGKKVPGYEVHHSIEHARSLFFTEILKGLPPDECERNVLAAVTHK